MKNMEKKYIPTVDRRFRNVIRKNDNYILHVSSHWKFTNVEQIDNTDIDPENY